MVYSIRRVVKEEDVLQRLIKTSTLSYNESKFNNAYEHVFWAQTNLLRTSWSLAGQKEGDMEIHASHLFEDMFRQIWALLFSTSFDVLFSSLTKQKQHLEKWLSCLWHYRRRRLTHSTNCWWCSSTTSLTCPLLYEWLLSYLYIIMHSANVGLERPGEELCSANHGRREN